MKDFLDSEGERIADPFRFDEDSLLDQGIKTIRGLYGVIGIAGIVAGLALLFWPIKTLSVLAVVLSVYFIVSAVVRMAAAIATPFMPAGWRALNVLASLLLLFCGIIMLRNQTASAFALATIATIAIGFGWIVEGVMTLIETGSVRNRGLAIFSGILSIVAGVIVLLFPLESVDMLILFAGIALAVLGVTLIARAFSFGKAVR